MVKNSVLTIFLSLALLSGLFSYISMDPMKSSFFLIGAMLFVMPAMSFAGNVWFSYFICLLFLSGIFVILVYFSSLSSFNQGKIYLVWVLLIFGISLLFMSFGLNKLLLGLNVFYYLLYLGLMFFILFNLLFFMCFTSYFLSFSGALRKV